MDIGLPDISGEEVTLEIRKENIKTPIIALTANDNSEVINKCEKTQINDFILKPITKDKCANSLDKRSEKSLKMLEITSY